MSNTYNGIIDLRGWLKMPNNGLLCLIKAQNLQEAESIAAKAVQIICNEGYAESSMVSYTSEECTISLHVAVEDEITQD